MNDRLLTLPRARSGQQRRGLQAGQAVEVSRGVMAGLTGVLVRRISGSRWIVRSEGAHRGLYLEISAAALLERRA